jgi:virulence-associated protein VapD
VGVTSFHESTKPPRAAQREKFGDVQTGRAFAILLDFDIGLLEQLYPDGQWQKAYADVCLFLTARGFQWKHGGLYIGNPIKIDAVQCVLSVQKLAAKHPWFRPSLRDIRMLRIEENSDLMAALDPPRED